MQYYKLEICGLTRYLPFSHISIGTLLSNFSLLGDVELVDRVADAFIEKLRAVTFDYFVGPELKAVPLVHGLAKRMGHARYAICRKTVRPYMVSPVILKPLPAFPKHIQQLVLNGTDSEMLKGKKVVMVDDVVSTGVTMRMMKKMMDNIGAETVCALAVLKQGEQFENTPETLYLSTIPIVKK